MATQTRLLVRPMQISSFIYGIFWAIVGFGVLFFADRSDISLLFVGLVIFLLGLGFGTMFGSLRLKLDVANGELKYQGFLSSYRVPLSEVTHVSIEHYTGGIFFPLNSPASLKVIHVHGKFEPKVLDGAVGKEKHAQRVYDYLTAQLIPAPEHRPNASGS